MHAVVILARIFRFHIFIRKNKDIDRTTTRDEIENNTWGFI